MIMTPVAVDSPLRKSDSRAFRTPKVMTNDDEAERRSRRFEASLDDNAMSTTSLVEDNENIKICLKLYSDNKLSKENAWSVSIIDTFSKLISRHSDTLQNFQVAGSTLEASTKVYGLRVDSVHTDVMRMCSELTRQSARAMDNNRKDDDEDVINDGAGKENDKTINLNKSTLESKKKKKTRRLVSTITKNKDTINAPLDTNPFTDPFFAKLNSVVGDVNSSNRLMQNIVPTSTSELRLRMDYPFWDNTKMADSDINAEIDYGSAEMSTISIMAITKQCVLHTMLSGYVITDTPAENDGNDDADKDKSAITPEESQLLNRSTLDLQFDINAAVEPISTEAEYMLDYGADDNNFDDFNEDDQTALNACRGLKRKTIVIEDMRPIDLSSANLEYSYRPLNMISQFWAGPSHWKFKRNKSKSLSLRFSSVPGTDQQSQSQKPARGKKKKRFEAETIDDLLSVDDSLYADVNPQKPMKHITYLKSSICKKWDSKKLKLPTNFKLGRNRFEVYRIAPGMQVFESESQQEPDIAVGDYNYDNPVDQNYCSRLQTQETDTDADNDGELPDNDDHQNFDDLGAPPNMNATADFISTEFQGAPDKVNKIIIPYAKTAKVVDMKQLKTCCWSLIENKTSAESELPPTFSYIFKELPHILTKSMSDNISKSLAFYSVLHLANEKSLFLIGSDNLKDFNIKLALN